MYKSGDHVKWGFRYRGSKPYPQDESLINHFIQHESRPSFVVWKTVQADEMVDFELDAERQLCAIADDFIDRMARDMGYEPRRADG